MASRENPWRMIKSKEQHEINALFSVPKEIYLLNHSVGCLPKKTRGDVNRYLDVWAENGSNAWEEWLQCIDSFNTSIARLLNTTATACCPQTNISSALCKVIHALPKRKGRRKIVLSEFDFPSMGYVLKQLEKQDYELEFIPDTNGSFPVDLWEQHLRTDVQLALVTHVLSENSYRHSVSELCSRAKDFGIFTIVDIAQSAGIIPIDVTKWQADFVMGSCVKWLCGGPGAGFLWVNLEEITQFQPIDVGWFSNETPLTFDIHDFQYAHDARRFWGGTPSILPFITAKAGIDQLCDIGIEKIYAHNLKLTSQLIDTALRLGLNVASSKNPEHCGGTVVIDFANREKAMTNFKQVGIHVDQRPKFGLRFSPHIYNTQEEIARVSDILADLVQNAP